MERRPLGFIYTNFDRHTLKKIKQSKDIDSAHILEELSKGICKEFLTCYPKCECFLYEIALRTPVVEEYFNQLSLMKPETVPILVYKNEDIGKSPLQHVLDENNINSTNLILKIIIKYQNNPCFNYLVDPLIKDLI